MRAQSLGSGFSVNSSVKRFCFFLQWLCLLLWAFNQVYEIVCNGVESIRLKDEGLRI